MGKWDNIETTMMGFPGELRALADRLEEDAKTDRDNTFDALEQVGKRVAALEDAIRKAVHLMEREYGICPFCGMALGHERDPECIMWTLI